MRGFRQVCQEIGQLKTIRALLDYLSLASLERFAFLLLSYWVLTPIIVLLSGIGKPQGDMSIQLNNMSQTRIFWYTILSQIGILGCALLILVLVKSILKARADDVGFKLYLIGHFTQIMFFLMLLWSFFSFIFSDNHRISFHGTLYRYDGFMTYLLYCGLFCCGYILRSRLLIKVLLEIYTGASTVLACLFVINLPGINGLFSLNKDSAIFFNQNHYGYFLCLAIMAAVLLLLLEQRNWLFLIFRIMVFAVLVAALLFNGSLGPYIAVVVGLLCSLALLHLMSKHQLKRIWLAPAVFIAVSVLLNLSNHRLGLDFMILFGDAKEILNNGENAGSAGSGRWQLWTNGLRFITERPFFGYGPDNLGAQYAAMGIKIDRPHNELIQIAASLGLPALLFYLTALGSLLISFIRRLKRLPVMMIGLFCMLAAYMVSAMVGNTMFYTTPFFMMFLGIFTGQMQTDDLGSSNSTLKPNP